MPAEPRRGRERRERRGISAGQLPSCFCPGAQECGRTQVSASGTMWRMEQTAKPVPRLRGRLGSCADGGGNEEKKKKTVLNKTSAGGLYRTTHGRAPSHHRSNLPPAHSSHATAGTEQQDNANPRSSPGRGQALASRARKGASPLSQRPHIPYQRRQSPGGKQ